MKYYKIKLRPNSSFGSPPMSDTIFGQIVWTLHHLGENVDELLRDYSSDPFLVVSDFFINDLGMTPKIPSVYSVGKNKKEKLDILLNRKENKSKSFIKISLLLNMEQTTYDVIREKSESLSKDMSRVSEVVRCSINRLSGTTGEDFSPYSLMEYFYNNIEFTFYYYCKDNFAEKVLQALSLMGQIGFGKDATAGKGKFDVLEETLEEIVIDKQNFNSAYTLSNCYLNGIASTKSYYEIFTRFGKHGDILATTGNPFKNPVVLARQGALLKFQKEKLPVKAYIGSGITDISYHSNTVMQGYSIYIPLICEEAL